MPDPRFELRKITDTEWLILDHRYAQNDSRRTVACIYEVDAAEVEVVWLRDLPLASSYMTAADVWEDVQRFHAPRRAGRPIPIPIPHHPPLATA
ncbi:MULTISPECIES: hypothetical protein [unclassified Microbacterium]|uniref:hypothetical protein n=1 Tax=unclassified Microbacterium TaxID=2609290 RepID=UPI00049330BD|nr:MULTISPECIES: hypothetical protein [unclassified Microbacterium]